MNNAIIQSRSILKVTLCSYFKQVQQMKQSPTNLNRNGTFYSLLSLLSTEKQKLHVTKLVDLKHSKGIKWQGLRNMPVILCSFTLMGVLWDSIYFGLILHTGAHS